MVIPMSFERINDDDDDDYDDDDDELLRIRRQTYYFGKVSQKKDVVFVWKH